MEELKYEILESEYIGVENVFWFYLILELEIVFKYD